MSAPVAIVQFCRDGEVRFSIAGDGPVRFLVVDERAPGDRVFEVTERNSPEELAALVPPGTPIGSSRDTRHGALSARLEAALEGRRHLRSVGGPA